MIKIQNLQKYFNKGKQNQIHVINDITLDLPDSGMVAVFGKSGCGKTTLLNVIGGLDGFESGSVSVEGESMRAGADELRNKYIGYIFQNYNLNRTSSCFDNVADALRLCGMTDEEQIKIRVMAALKNVGLENYHARTPDTLSGGQQQRIAIARAIVKNPRIILADEPTGNLDEANTVMVMNLLKAISKDHLILLVTHEANLVDYYCDTVIELLDGRVESIKNNESADGYTQRSKTDIYLGEIERSEVSGDAFELEYYGEKTASPIKLRLVNSGGRIYLQINTPGVQLLDAGSEIKLREGVYEETEQRTRQNENIDMTSLPPVKGTRFGRLFSFKSAIKSGYTANFKKGKRGKKVLFGCLCLFAAIIVMMSAVFGTSVSEIFKARDSYNHNVFYVYTADKAVSDKLHGALENGEHGIDALRLHYGEVNGDMDVKFMTGFFETFSTARHDEAFQTNAVLLSSELIKDMKVLEGKAQELDEYEIVISSRVADALIDKSSLGYIDDYRSLLGLITHSLSVNGEFLRIAGVVDCDEPAIYLSELSLAKYVMSRSSLGVKHGVDHGVTTEQGKLVYAYRPDRVDPKLVPKVGDKISIQGRELEVGRVVRYAEGYESWLSAKNIKKMSLYMYFSELDSEQTDQRYFEYYDYYFAEFDEYIGEMTLFGNDGNIMLWLATEKQNELAAHTLMQHADSMDYYLAKQYKQKNGAYPSLTELSQLKKAGEVISAEAELETLTKRYDREFNEQIHDYIQSAYFVSTEDYIDFSRHTGETHDSARNGNYVSGKDIYYEEIGGSGSYFGITGSADIAYASVSASVYTVIHTSDPQATDAFLRENFSDIKPTTTYSTALLTPSDIFTSLISEHTSEIVKAIIAMAVILAIMSVCIYFIMRSSLMNRIKEVGIYRAIGVTKKNLLFKFLVEALVLTTLTVLVGYLLTSGFIAMCLGLTSFMEAMLYYPLWMAFAVLGVLYAVCMFFGTLPAISLLRKTPSEILSKYDI